MLNGSVWFRPSNRFSSSVTAKKSQDDSVTFQFGGCYDETSNCLPIMPGWNYTARLHRLRAEILNGTWTFHQTESVR